MKPMMQHANKSIVVEDFGITPYWWGSITFNTAGLTYVFTRNSSAILEMHEVREIGLRSFFGSWTIFVFGRGITSAFFQRVGRRCSLYDAFRIRETGKVRINEYSFKHQLGILSGPAALLILSFDKALCTIISDTFGKTGDSSNGSFGKGNCKLYSFSESKNIVLILDACSSKDEFKNSATFVRFESPLVILSETCRLF